MVCENKVQSLFILLYSLCVFVAQQSLVTLVSVVQSDGCQVPTHRLL